MILFLIFIVDILFINFVCVAYCVERYEVFKLGKVFGGGKINVNLPTDNDK